MNYGYGTYYSDDEDVRKPYNPRGTSPRIDYFYLDDRAHLKPDIGLAAEICARLDKAQRTSRKSQ